MVADDLRTVLAALLDGWTPAWMFGMPDVSLYLIDGACDGLTVFDAHVSAERLADVYFALDEVTPLEPYGKQFGLWQADESRKHIEVLALIRRAIARADKAERADVGGA